MPNVSTASAQGFATFAATNQWSATAGATLQNSTCAAVRLNLSVMTVAGTTSFYNGSYSIAYLVNDNSGLTYTYSPMPATATLNSNAVNFVVQITAPTGSYLPSPLNLNLTLTNTGGGDD
jgi:hypothetical protein